MKTLMDKIVSEGVLIKVPGEMNGLSMVKANPSLAALCSRQDSSAGDIRDTEAPEVVFPTEQSLHDFAALYYPDPNVFIELLRKILDTDGLDSVNRFVLDMYPPGDKCHHMIELIKNMVRDASAWFLERR